MRSQTIIRFIAALPGEELSLARIFHTSYDEASFGGALIGR